MSKELSENNSKIYLVMLGEYYQGESVLGVSYSLAKATQIAENEFARWSGYDHKRKIDEMNWDGDGCDYIEIRQYEVE